MNRLKYITSGIFLILIQLLVSGYVNIWPMLYIAVFPLLLITLPYYNYNFLSMVIAFVVGLFIDVTSDGVLGLNAAAAVALSFFRAPLLRMAISKPTLENISEITQRTIGTTQFVIITALSYAVFFMVYIALDSWGYFSFLYTAVRFLINVAVNTCVALLLWKTINSQIFR